ncbi:MAG: transglutaminase domain-containing protein [Sedimentisphaerales bacterium]|nr:transglutaminase domain-containing protein [Sedimentisphaerales bacterium]
MMLGINRKRLSVATGVCLAAGVLVFAVLSGCDKRQETDKSEKAEPYVPTIVTGEIQAGIEKHIAEQVEKGDGYFTVEFEGKELKLKLVRVHVEYLASLAPQRHFACVDMVSSDGQFYDIDFFMAGDPGAMTVTETTVHKLNGKPYYVWKQKEDKTWVRAPVEDASQELLGVLTGRDTFEFCYQATLPEITGAARCWIPLGRSDNFQKVTVKSISVPGTHKTLVDKVHGNRILFLELGPEDSSKELEIVYDVERLEKGAYADDPTTVAKYLQPESMVPSDDKFKAIAEKAVQGREGDLMRARALYDHVIDEMNYKKFGEGWGKGDAVYACNSLYGNCTDYHAYFIGLARSIGIPARFAIGASIPSERNDGGTDGYHCWAEFFADGKWWPVDISEADKFSALSMYFFGHHPANRFEFTRGRDLVVEPGPASGPINFLAYPLLEIEGKPQKVKTLFLFKRTICDARGKTD